MSMNAFDPAPPRWTQTSVHAHHFGCPQCQASCLEAEQVWINRRAPVVNDKFQRQWQEFYQCHCGQAWWAWSCDRPPSELSQRDPQ
jgi:hypothetical protein